MTGSREGSRSRARLGKTARIGILADRLAGLRRVDRRRLARKLLDQRIGPVQLAGAALVVTRRKAAARV